MGKRFWLPAGLLLLVGLVAAGVFYWPRLYRFLQPVSFQTDTPLGPITRVETSQSFDDYKADAREKLWVVHIASSWSSQDDLSTLLQTAQESRLVDDAHAEYAPVKHSGGVYGANVDVAVVFSLPLARRGEYLQFGKIATRLPAPVELLGEELISEVESVESFDEKQAVAGYRLWVLHCDPVTAAKPVFRQKDTSDVLMSAFLIDDQGERHRPIEVRSVYEGSGWKPDALLYALPKTRQPRYIQFPNERQFLLPTPTPEKAPD